MPFDISQFVQKIAASNGIMGVSHFQVQITTPPSLLTLLGAQGSSPFSTTANIIPFFCEAAQLPGVELATSIHQRYGYGANEKKPFGVNFSDIQLRFIGDGQGEIWNYFQNWIKLIVNTDARNGINSSTANLGSGTAGGQLLSSSSFPYEVGYKSDYCVDLVINIYDKAGNETIIVTLREAYPLFLGDIKLDWMAGKEIMKIPVVFTFVDWYNQMISGGSTVTPSTIVNSLGTTTNQQGINQNTQQVNSTTIAPGDPGSPGNTD